MSRSFFWSAVDSPLMKLHSWEGVRVGVGVCEGGGVGVCEGGGVGVCVCV